MKFKIQIIFQICLVHASFFLVISNQDFRDQSSGDSWPFLGVQIYFDNGVLYQCTYSIMCFQTAKGMRERSRVSKSTWLISVV